MEQLICLDDLRRFRNVLLLAQSNPVQGMVPRMLLQDPAVQAFLLQGGTPLPGVELEGAGSICAVVGFDDAHADLGAVGKTLLRLLDGHRVPTLVVAPVPDWFAPHLAQLRQVADRLVLCDNYKAGQVFDGLTVVSLETYQRQAGVAAPALLVATRDEQLARMFREAIPSEVTLTLNRLMERRLEVVRARYGDLPVYDASWFEGSLGQIGKDDDLARVIQFAYRHLTPSSVVFDVGAHSGYTARLFRQRCARVYAFEPDPEPFAAMADRFRGQASITPVPAALGRNAGQATLNLDYRGPTGGSSSLLGHLFTEPQRLNSAKATVQVLTLDGFCETQGVIPDFLKIDVEGSEPDVVAGGWDVLRRHRPPLVYEQYCYFAQLRPDDYSDMMDRLATLYHLECQETGEDPRVRFMKPEMPPLTNVACHPRRAGA
jgi:FkbM family methyltransferase